MADYAGVLADLKARRAAIDAERTELDGLIQGVERMLARYGATKAASPSPIAQAAISTRPRAFAGKTMPEAVKGFFKAQMALQPYATRQVTEGVRAGGFKGGKNLRGHVYNTLHRLSQDSGPILHHADGRWSLREWNLPVGEQRANQSVSFLEPEGR
jgi:hypothetical protein